MRRMRTRLRTPLPRQRGASLGWFCAEALVLHDPLSRSALQDMAVLRRMQMVATGIIHGAEHAFLGINAELTASASIQQYYPSERDNQQLLLCLRLKPILRGDTLSLHCSTITYQTLEPNQTQKLRVWNHPRWK